MQALDGLLDYLVTQRACPGGVPSGDVAVLERLFAVRLPESYRQFLQRCGALTAGALEIHGLGVPSDSPLSVARALQAFRHLYPTAAPGLVPIRLAGPGALHCLDCTHLSTDGAEAPVILFNLNNGTSQPAPISLGFTAYLQAYVHEWYHREVGLRLMDTHARRFDSEYLRAGKLARNHIWRPYRFCVQDVVLGLVVVRHSLADNCLEVDVCLTSDVPEYEPGSGARMTATFLLSEAYKCGGSMEIRFSRNVEGGTVPATLGRLAQGFGVELRHRSDGRIVPSEARQLFLALTGFAPDLHAKIMALRTAGKLSPERVCYSVHHGIWMRSEVESLVFGSLWPETIFAGEVVPEQRLLYHQAILHTRSAILGGLLDRTLAKRHRLAGDVALDLEDDTRRVAIGFDAEYYAKIYRCDEDLPVPWLDDSAGAQEAVQAGQPLHVLLRARDPAAIVPHFAQDLAVATQMSAAARSPGAPARAGLVVPRDFEDLPAGEMTRLRTSARARGIDLLVCPETVATLDSEASRRLSSSRIIRQ